MTPKSKEWSFSIHILHRGLGRIRGIRIELAMKVADHGKFEDFRFPKHKLCSSMPSYSSLRLLD